mgnify:CR=1 FL=1
MEKVRRNARLIIEGLADVRDEINRSGKRKPMLVMGGVVGVVGAGSLILDAVTGSFLVSETTVNSLAVGVGTVSLFIGLRRKSSKKH